MNYIHDILDEGTKTCTLPVSGRFFPWQHVWWDFYNVEGFGQFSNQLIRKLAKSCNIVKIPPNVPPGEKSSWHWQYTRFCTFVQNIMNIIHQLTKIQAFSRTVKLCLLSRVMFSGVQGQIMPKFTGTPCLKIPMMIHRVGTWPLAMASYMSRFQPLGVSSLPAWLTSGLSPTFLACILTEIRLSTPHALAMSHEPPPTHLRPFLKSSLRKLRKNY